MIEKFILSWYFVLTILGLAFLLFNGKPIAELIRKIKIRNKKFGISTEEEQNVINDEDLKKLADYFKENKFESYGDFESFVSGVFSQLTDKTRIVQDSQKSISELLEIAEYYQFMYLNLYLVLNSKISLLFFKNCGGCTKEVYIKNFILPPNVINSDNEREVIFSTLLSNGLIEEKTRNLFIISAKGEKFLKFIGLTK